MKQTLSFALVLFCVCTFCLFPGCKKQTAPASSGQTSTTDNTVVITSISPSSGRSGDKITVHGKNFPDQSGIKASINDRPLTILTATSDSLQFTVPAGIGSGAVTLNIANVSYEGPEFTYDFNVWVSTLAGSGSVGKGDAQGQLATFNCPWGITADANGDLYVADCYNRLIRKITGPDSMVSTISIPTFIDTATFYSPYNLTLDPKTHNLYVTDFNTHLMKISASGNMSVIYEGVMPLAGIAMGPDGFLYVSNNTLGEVLKMDTTGGNSSIFATGLITPRNIIFDRQGKMYVATQSVMQIDNMGKSSVFLKDPAFQGWEIAVDSAGNFYEADHFANCIRRIDKNGEVSLLAGNGVAADVDGPGLQASFDGPQGLTIDSKGNLYVTTYNYNDASGNKVRKITFR